MNQREGIDKDELAERALANAVDRLDDKFPEVPREEIEELVEEKKHDFDGARITDHIPNLVEHDVRDELRDQMS